MKQDPSPSTQKVTPWKLLSSKPALQNKWFPVRQDTVRLPQGTIIDDYFVWEAPHIVSVVPVTAEGKFVVVRQYRHARGKVLHQFPAGAVDKNETPEQAALRELREETGYTAARLVPLATLAPYATKMTGLDSVFIALDATFESEPHYDEQEEGEVLCLSLDELWEVIESGDEVMTQLPALLLLALRYQQKV